MKPPDADTAMPPQGTRLILVAENLLEFMGTRSDDGRRLTYEWGDPDEHGWYTPTITAHEPAALTVDTLATALAAAFAEYLPDVPFAPESAMAVAPAILAILTEKP